MKSFFTAGLLALAFALTQPLPARSFKVVAYNVENLFDADGIALYEDYQPPRYTRTHLLTKLQNAVRIIARYGAGRGPEILILSELEIDATPSPRPPDYDAIAARYAGLTLADMLGEKFDDAIADLPSEALLAKALAERGITGYRILVAERARAEGGDRRLAQKCAIFTRFPVLSFRAHPTRDARPILEARLDVDGASLHVFANHWKSGAGDPATEPIRIANARTLRARLDEILRADPDADIILGGDFNSQYNQKERYPAMKTTALDDILRSQGDELAVRDGRREFYNLWYELPADQRGSDTYRGEWGTLMHLIVSRGLYDYRGVQYQDNSFAVGIFSGLNTDDNGLPLRWSFVAPAGGGFSDHFPVSARFATVPDGRTERRLTLRHPSVELPGDAVPRTIDYASRDLERTAVTAAHLPPGADIRTEIYLGRIFRVEGRVTADSRLAVEFRGKIYDVWSHDEALRNRLRADHRAGAVLRFYGELGQYRGRWQFVIQDPSWVR